MHAERVLSTIEELKIALTKTLLKKNACDAK